MRAWPGARKEPKELSPATLFWQSFRDHLCFRHSLPHSPGQSTCTKAGVPPTPCSPHIHPVHHWPAPVGESWRHRRVSNVMANLQAHSLPSHLLVVSLSFIPLLHWIFLGMDAGFWFPCEPRGLETQNRGGFFIPPALSWSVGGDKL